MVTMEDESWEDHAEQLNAMLDQLIYGQREEGVRDPRQGMLTVGAFSGGRRAT